MGPIHFMAKNNWDQTDPKYLTGLDVRNHGFELLLNLLCNWL